MAAQFLLSSLLLLQGLREEIRNRVAVREIDKHLLPKIEEQTVAHLISPHLI